MRWPHRVVAFLIVLLLTVPLIPSGAVPSAQASDAPQTNPVWNLIGIRVYYNPPPATNVLATSLVADGAGGEVLVTIDGKAFNLCPGGSEKMQVKWRFDRSVAQLQLGQRMSIALTGIPVTGGPPCDGRLIVRTFIGTDDSDGSTTSWWTDAEKSTMYDAMYFISGDRAWQPTWGTNRVLGVRERFPSSVDGAGRPDLRKYTWFSIQIQNPGTDVHVVYLYELSLTGATSPQPPTGPTPPQPPTGAGPALGGVDLRGFCQSLGGDDIGLDGADWYCGFIDDWIAIDMTAACRWQYGRPDASAQQRIPGDPQTWVCFAPDAGGGLPPGGPSTPPTSLRAPQSLGGSSGGPVGCIGCDGKYRILVPGTTGVLLVADRSDPAVAQASAAVPGPGTLRNLRVQASAADGGIWYFFLYRPGNSGGLSCTIDGQRNPGQTVCEDRASSFVVEAGDRIVLAVGNPGTPQTQGQFGVDWSVEFTPR